MQTIKRKMCAIIKKVLADGGYTGEKFAQFVKSFSGADADFLPPTIYALGRNVEVSY